MSNISYKEAFEGYLESELRIERPENLYRPVHYIMQLGGKRLRPVLLLTAARAYGGKVEDALPAALAIELFHNFTLMHDDIMDKAEQRRGKPSVHAKWDVNTAILSGDVTLILAYEYLQAYPAALFLELSRLFNTTARYVCEGQQWDMDFETLQNIELDDYLLMIKNKTAVLLAASLQMGAMIAGASAVEQKKIYDFGIRLGLAFQLQDDYLDTFGDPETFGKKIGGDILENKKTILYVLAMQYAAEPDKEKLRELYFRQQNLSKEDKIKQVRDIFIRSQADQKTLELIEKYMREAVELLNGMEMHASVREDLRALADRLAARNH